MPESADAIVVGGGVIGASIAYHLALRSYGRILLLERDTVACGSTGSSVASVDFMTLHPNACELYARSSAFFLHCNQILEAECGFIETGFIILAGAGQRDALTKAVRFMADAGVEVRLLPIETLALMEPGIQLNDIQAASFAPRAGYADPVLTTQAFAGAAVRHGAEIRQGTRVEALSLGKGRVQGLHTQDGFIEAPVVVIAAGAWSGGLVPKEGIDIGLKPVKHPVVCLRRSQPEEKPRFSMLDLVSNIYARPDAGHFTLAGSIDPSVGYDPAGPEYDHRDIDESYIIWTVERLARRLPNVATSQLCPGWTGIMTLSPDFEPVVGQWPGVQGLYCAAGFSGRGFQVSPSVGDLLAGLIAGDKTAATYLAPFSPIRFVGGWVHPPHQRGNMFGLRD